MDLLRSHIWTVKVKNLTLFPAKGSDEQSSGLWPCGMPRHEATNYSIVDLTPDKVWTRVIKKPPNFFRSR